MADDHDQTPNGPNVVLRETLAQRWADLTSEDLKTLEEDIHSLVTRIQAKTGESREVIARFLLEHAANARLASEHVAEDALQASRQLREYAEELVRSSPARAVAAGFGFGVLAGLFLSAALRRR